MGGHWRHGKPDTHRRKRTAELLHARQALRRRGLLALLRAVAREYVVDRSEFYLYEHHHRVWEETDFRPRLEQWEEHFVSCEAEADWLAQNHEDFRLVKRHASQGLSLGAVAFCVYVGREVAHIAWLATSGDGRRAVDQLGYEVRFDEGEAWTGAAWTALAYRGKGLLTYSCHKRFEYLLQSGCERSRGAVDVGNRVSHRATMRFEPVVYGIGRQWLVFGRRWWSEREVSPLDDVDEVALHRACPV